MNRSLRWLVVSLIGLWIAATSIARATGRLAARLVRRNTSGSRPRTMAMPAAAAMLFADSKRLACARCHRVGGEGGDIGPDLSDIGGKFDRALLIESVLEPSRQIVEGYRTTTIATKDGRVLSGIARDETSAGWRSSTPTGRETSSAPPRSRIESADTSLMPSSLAAGLSPAEFVDLIAYLETLRSNRADHAAAGFTWSRVATGITGATAMEVAPDGRVFVCEQTGALRVVKGGQTAGPAVRDATGGQHVGARLDRRGPRPGLRQEQLRLRQLRGAQAVSPPPRQPLHRQGDVAAADSEDPVRRRRPDEARRRGAGRPPGRGDPLRQGRQALRRPRRADRRGKPAQAMDSLLGKLLRINPDGSIPEDNPFYGKARGKYRAIWALGLRNPFTFAVQPGTGRIFINDVGQAAWEEIDEGFAGANYGWPASEGPTTDPRFRGPIHHYPVASVAGGAFCPAAVPPASRRVSAAGISSPISSRVGSRSSTRITRKRSRRSPRGWPGRSTCSSARTAASMCSSAMPGSLTGTFARGRDRYSRFGPREATNMLLHRAVVTFLLVSVACSAGGIAGRGRGKRSGCQRRRGQLRSESVRVFV